MGYSKLEPKFNLGRIVATSGVMSLGIDLIPFIRRHHCGEWGDVCADDKEANNLALADGERLLSKYHVVAASGTRVPIYVITERGRHLTTVLLTDEY